MKTEQSTGPIAYSYVRFSSKKQEEGDSIRRQVELTSAWAKRSKIHLDTSLAPDRGVSAFRGKNRDLGALGEFLRLVEKGRVSAGSYLVVESLDRLTREEIQPALLLILSLLQKGIRVVQLKPVEMVYDAKSDTTPIILMLVELSRGHSESKVKSDRVSEAWGERRKSARAGKGIFTHKLPLWVEERGGVLAAIPERAKAVRRIFELSAGGNGLYAIMNALKAEKVPAFGPSGRWSMGYVNIILRDRRALGEFQPKLRGGKPDGAPIAGYFPKVVSEEQWERARASTAQRFEKHRPKGGRVGNRVNVFQGLLKSARDGFGYVVASASSKNPHAVIRSAGHRLGASRVDSFPLDTFEKAILSRLREIDPREIVDGEEKADDSEALTTELARVEASIAAINREMDERGESDSLFKRLRAKETRQGELKVLVGQAKQQKAHPLSDSWDEAKTLLAVLEKAPDQREARLRLREALRRIVSEIRVLVVADPGDRRNRLAVVQIWFTAAGAGEQRHRDYLIVHRSAVAAGNDKCLRRPSSWTVEDAAWEGGARDLRRPEDAKELERDLLRAMETATAEKTAATAKTGARVKKKPAKRR